MSRDTLPEDVALALLQRVLTVLAVAAAVALAWVGTSEAQPASAAPAAAASAPASVATPAPPPPKPADRVLTLPPGRAAGAGADDEAVAITFIGTATTLIRHGGFTILTDPNFLHRGERAPLGYGLSSKRLTEPAMTLQQLPPIDLVLLSHHHGDHFDPRVERELDHATPIVTTPHALAKLRRAGFDHARALVTWESLDVIKGDARLRITAMPARHGPPVVARALPQTMGSLLEFLGPDGRTRFSLYISGDTLVFDELRQIPQRHPDIDLALLHLGGTRVAGMLVTMDARQGVEALQIVQPTRAVPIHFDDYAVFKSPLADFLRAAEAAGWKDRIRVIARGETVRFPLAARRPAGATPASAPAPAPR